MVGVRGYVPLHPALMKWFMATEMGFQMQKFECRSPKYPHAMLEVLSVPLLKPDAADVRSPGWLVAGLGAGGGRSTSAPPQKLSCSHPSAEAAGSWWSPSLRATTDKNFEASWQ